MNPGQELLFATLDRQAPLVGLFGQAAGWSTRDGDPVLEVALKHLGREAQDDGWNALTSSVALPEAFYGWLDERFTRRLPSEELAAALDAPFSAVFTSSVDPGFSNLLATGGREPKTVLVGEPLPPVMRSKRRPPVYYLFGSARPGPTPTQPPIDRKSLNQRRGLHAGNMLRAIYETATAIGLIVIDGYFPTSDWLRAEDLLAVLGAGRTSVLWCGREPTFSNVDDAETYSGLVADGVIVRDVRSFGALYAELTAKGATESVSWDDPELISFANGKKLVVSAGLRLATQASATILDDSVRAFLPPLDGGLDESGFQNFHAIPASVKIRIDGIRRGYAFKRDFEARLTTRVRKALAHHHAEPGAIVLYGQSGIGKSVALARLAYEISASGEAAVLYASERNVVPSDVTAFLSAVDSLDRVSLLIVDVSSPPDRFDELLNALRSRGHRVVVVGTSYRTTAARSLGDRGIEAPDTLSANEQIALTDLSRRFNVASAPPANSPHALARFYLALPPSRGLLARALGGEARYTEASIRRRGGAIQTSRSVSGMGAALIRAGYANADTPLLPDDQEALASMAGDTAAGRVVDYVMVVSRLYKTVPVNLVLRAVTNQAAGGVPLEVIQNLFDDQDLFRWRYADEDGEELTVGARLQLEAELICSRRLGGAAGEAARLIELINSAYRAGSESHEETRFLTDIVYAMGPDGPARERYRDAYAEIARALTRLRRDGGVINARLMLQEASLRRTYVRTHTETISSTERASLLAEAIEAVEGALDAVRQTGRERIYVAARTEDNLWVERAAIYGFLATASARNADPPETVWTNYLAAREAIRVATARIDTYFPQSIGLWTPGDVLQELRRNAMIVPMGVARMSELEADIRASLDNVDVRNLTPHDLERFQRQRQKLGGLLDDTPLSEEAFNELAAMGSAAGYYLRARALAPRRPDMGEEATPVEVSAASTARNYLRAHYDSISSDISCLSLLLNNDWTAETGRWLFRGTRQPIPAGDDVRQRLRTVALDLLGACGTAPVAKHRYLECVLSWLVDDEMAAIRKWRQLAADTEYIEQGRVLSRHTLCNAAGEPTMFNGIVDRQLNGAGRWSVRVQGSLQRNVDLSIPPGNEPAHIGQELRNFHVAFSYIGPIAEFPRSRGPR